MVVQGDVHNLLRETDFFVTEVQVDDSQRAFELLRQEAWVKKVSIVDELLKVQMPGESRPALTEFLVKNNFAVSAVVPRTSLEDYYLSLLKIVNPAKR
jgi:hypothetical protein